MINFSRRGFLAAGAATLAYAHIPQFAFAQAAAPIQLTAGRRTLDIGGRAASVLGLIGPDGRPGVMLDPGQRFAVDLTNDLDVETIIHWHGQIPPNVQDGVPDAPMAALKPGEVRSYDFAPSAGTHWMHSHIPIQEMQMLAAPLIVRRPEDIAADRQEVVMFLHDFSFRPAEEVLAEIVSGAGHGDMGEANAMSGMDHGGHGSMPMPQMPSASQGEHDMAGMREMDSMQMDLNDFDFDAYLANDRTLDDPDTVSVEANGRVLLRVINGAAATSFWIDSGNLPGRLVAVDGQPIEPIPGNRFGLSMGQRLDLELELPDTGAWPVLALREGARERTGLILATPGAQVRRIDSLAEADAPPFDIRMEQESRLRAVTGLADRGAIRPIDVMLGGQMQPYVWTIDGKTWGEHLPISARSGDRVEIRFHNMSMMGHPMHLHGHHFQVVEIGGRRMGGAMRDTLYIPPMTMATIAVDAGEAARWMLHCHHMPHLSTGMMTEFVVA
jgi:FtsP/CotA-like multicopper oxidase with cupredoxin domain